MVEGSPADPPLLVSPLTSLRRPPPPAVLLQLLVERRVCAAQRVELLRALARRRLDVQRRRVHPLPRVAGGRAVPRAGAGGSLRRRGGGVERAGSCAPFLGPLRPVRGSAAVSCAAHPPVQVSFHNCHIPFVGTPTRVAACNASDSTECAPPLPGTPPYNHQVRPPPRVPAAVWGWVPLYRIFPKICGK